MKLENNYRLDVMWDDSIRLWINESLTACSINVVANDEFDYIKIDDGDWSNFDKLLEYKDKITRLAIHTDNIDWHVLSKFENIKRLYIGGWFKCGLEFDKLHQLKHLVTYWNDGYNETLKNLSSLTSLRVIGYKNKDLSTLGEMKNLKCLALHKSKSLKSLENLRHFKQLKYLEIEGCGGLTDLKEMTELQHLMYLNISCKKGVDYSAIGKLSQLEELTFNGVMEDLHWLINLKQLKKLRFDGKIEDGNIDVLYDLPSLEFVRFNNKRNFSVKLKDIQQHLTDKGFNQDVNTVDFKSYHEFEN